MSETQTLSHQKALTERLIDPQVSLGDVLSDVGFEGLDPEGRLEVIEHATLDDYLTAVDVIHRKVAPEESQAINPDRTKIVNPHTGEVRQLTAAPVERVDIMDHALRNAQLVAAKYRREGGSIDDALQRCGNLAAFGIVLAHNYAEGNGRTARTAGELIHRGYDSANPESVSNLAAVSANRGSRYRMLSYVPQGEWQDRANQGPMAFLDAIAAIEQPLDGTSYAAAVRGSLTTPRMA